MTLNQLADELHGLCHLICPDVHPCFEGRFLYFKAATSYVESPRDIVGCFSHATRQLIDTLRSESVARSYAALDTSNAHAVSASIRTCVADLCLQAERAVSAEQKLGKAAITNANGICFRFLGVTPTVRYENLIQPKEWYDGWATCKRIEGDLAKRMELAAAIAAHPRLLVVIGTSRESGELSADAAAGGYWTAIHDTEHKIYGVRQTLRKEVERFIVYLRECALRLERTTVNPGAVMSSGINDTKHPAVMLDQALVSLVLICGNAHVFQVLGDARRERNAAALSRPPGHSEPEEARQQLIENVLNPGIEWVERARAAIRLGGAEAWDAATAATSDGRPRSIALGADLANAERLFRGLIFWLNAPQTSLGDDAGTMRDLASRFREARNELGAVLETRGSEAPALTPTGSVSPELPDLRERAAAAGEGRTSAPGIGGTGNTWQSVQGQLLVKYERGEACTTHEALAIELGCSEGLIRKAIRKSVTLKGWRARSGKPKAAPKATDLSAVERAGMRQRTDPAPDDVLPDDEVEATMAWLIDQAGPDERAKLNALDDAGRRALVAEFQSQNLDDEPSPLEPDKPGKRRRKVTQHKRA